MQCFFVHFICDLGKTYDVAAKLADREIASEIYSTSGDYDLMAKFYLPKDEDIGRFVADNLHDIPGVQRTMTVMTFKAF